MFRTLVFILCFILYSVVFVLAQADGAITSNASNTTNTSGEPEAKTLSGMSVLGNQEAPMSLFIVPWKSSELGVETNVHRTLDERDVPVDREVFMRELDFYQVSVGGKTPGPPEVSQAMNSR
jgi:hypothetical protein